MAAALLLALKISIVAVVFGIGLGSTPADLGYLWKRPSLLARSLFAMYVGVPLAAWGLVRLFDPQPPIRAAALVLAISAGAPLLPRKLMKLGNNAYVFSLLVTSSLLAVVVVPLWVAALGPLFGREAAVGPAAVALLLGKAFLGPLLLGMLARRIFRGAAGRVSEVILSACGALIGLTALGLLVVSVPLLLEVGWRPPAALAILTAAALAVGHVFGGPAREDRTALAVCCATRHVGIAMLAASVAPNPRTVAFVLAYLLASAVVSSAYLAWRGRRPSA